MINDELYLFFRAEKLKAQKPEATDRTRWQHPGGDEPGTSHSAEEGATSSPDTGRTQIAGLIDFIIVKRIVKL